MNLVRYNLLSTIETCYIIKHINFNKLWIQSSKIMVNERDIYKKNKK